MERIGEGAERSASGWWRSNIKFAYELTDQRFSPQFLHLRLRHAIIAQDDKSEGLASEFVQDQRGLEIEEFVKEYKELRKVYHKRAIWNERWSNGQVEWGDDA